MNWPLPQDFNEAVQNPSTAFGDPDLKTGQTIVGPSGLPLPRSGNFADVYQIRGADNRDWAIKCFTRPVTGLEQRYKKVEDALDRAGLSFTVDFTFLNKGVLVRGKWLPAVKMEWVDGLQLNHVVRNQAGNPKVLDALGMMWSRLCKKLRDAGIAHADLQHGNVLLVVGSKPGSYHLKLIDYDGMYVPALANTPSGESGHPNFQHPDRAAKQVYSPDLDRFPHLVIATALKGLAVLGPKLWEDHDTGDNLLFTDEDFRKPAASALMMKLWYSNNPELQAMVGHLAVACGKPIPQTPWLDQIAPDGTPVPLSATQAKAAAIALGVAPSDTGDVRVLRDDVIHGPFTREQIQEMLANNKETFSLAEQCCRVSVQNGPWIRISEYLGSPAPSVVPGSDWIAMPTPMQPSEEYHGPPPATKRPIPPESRAPEDVDDDTWTGVDSNDAGVSLLERRYRNKKVKKTKRVLLSRVLIVLVLSGLCIVAWWKHIFPPPVVVPGNPEPPPGPPPSPPKELAVFNRSMSELSIGVDDAYGAQQAAINEIPKLEARARPGEALARAREAFAAADAADKSFSSKLFLLKPQEIMVPDAPNRIANLERKLKTLRTFNSQLASTKERLEKNWPPQPPPGINRAAFENSMRALSTGVIKARTDQLVELDKIRELLSANKFPEALARVHAALVTADDAEKLYYNELEQLKALGKMVPGAENRFVEVEKRLSELHNSNRELTSKIKELEAAIERQKPIPPGTWVNADKKVGELTRLVVSNPGNVWTLEGWGSVDGVKEVPQGRATLTQGDRVKGNVATWHHPNAINPIAISNLTLRMEKEQLVVEIITTFRDKGQKDVSLVEKFNKKK